MIYSIKETPGIDLEVYQKIPISFTVRNILELLPDPPDRWGLMFGLKAVALPFVKDYDRPGNRPVDWARTWDLARWGFLSAFADEVPAGGTDEQGPGVGSVGSAPSLAGVCAIAWRTPEINMLEGRRDLAVLWDIRIDPRHRGRGLGTRLFSSALEWVRAREGTGLKIETQNINVPACRFYAAQGCRLAAIDTRAYPDCPGEIQFIWHHDLRQ